MWKKRMLILGLVLLPIATGTAVIASFANGSRARELTPLHDTAATGTDAGTTSSQTHDGSSPQIDAVPTTAPNVLPQNTPAKTQEPNSTEDPIVIKSDEVSSEPMFASADNADWQDNEPPIASTYARSAIYTLADRADGVAGGSGGGPGGGASTPSGTDDSGGDVNDGPSTPPANSKNPAGDPSSDSGDSTDNLIPPNTAPDDDSTDEGNTEEPIFVYVPPEKLQPPVQVPEPTTLGLLGLGLLGCAVARRKKAS